MADALLKIEITLRNFLCFQLRKAYNSDWENHYGVPEARIEKWKERKVIEEIKFRDSGTVEDRLIYYSDFYDLLTIISKNWEHCFKDVFQDKRETDIFLKKLDSYRNVEAHRRELLSHQKELLLGISGELRNKIIRYQSKMEHDLDIFPRLERISDNYGNTWSIGKNIHNDTGILLHPGDVLEFIIDATDPEDAELMYCIQGVTQWQSENLIKLEIEERHIALRTVFAILMKSNRSFHSHNDRDGEIHFSYKILPRKK